MLIRSQDKKTLVNIDNIASISVIKGFKDNEFRTIVMYSATSHRDYFNETIGKYSTEEKAMEVLDMIQNEYSKYFKCEGGALATANFYVQPMVSNYPKVFQIPQDNKVK